MNMIFPLSVVYGIIGGLVFMYEFTHGRKITLGKVAMQSLEKI